MVSVRNAKDRALRWPQGLGGKSRMSRTVMKTARVHNGGEGDTLETCTPSTDPAVKGSGLSQTFPLKEKKPPDH